MSVTVNTPASPAPLSTNTAIQVTDASTQVPASATSIPVTLAPEATATVVQPYFEGVEVTVEPLRIVLLHDLASGARGVYLGGAIVLGAAYLLASVAMWMHRSDREARWLFRVSLLYLPLLLGLLVYDRLTL